jgi:hypothetical protein
VNIDSPSLGLGFRHYRTLARIRLVSREKLSATRVATEHFFRIDVIMVF